MNRHLVAALTGVLCVGGIVVWRYAQESELGRVRLQVQSLERKLASAEQTSARTFVLGPSSSDEDIERDQQLSGTLPSASSPAATEEDQTLDPVVRDQIAADEQFNELEAAFRADDPSSSEDSKSDLSETLEVASAGSAQVQSIECRSQICRAELQTLGREGLTSLVEHMTRGENSWPGALSFVKREEDTEGRWKVVAYFGTEGRGIPKLAAR